MGQDDPRGGFIWTAAEGAWRILLLTFHRVRGAAQIGDTGRSMQLLREQVLCGLGSVVSALGDDQSIYDDLIMLRLEMETVQDHLRMLTKDDSAVFYLAALDRGVKILQGDVSMGAVRNLVNVLIECPFPVARRRPKSGPAGETARALVSAAGRS